jgi:hypothetical protein
MFDVDVLSGLGAGGWGLLAGWILPAALAAVGVAYGVLPSTALHHDFTHKLSIAEQALVLASAAFGVGLVLNAVQTPLYRLLEGYARRPEWFWKWRASRQLKRRNSLRERMENADGIKLGLLIERVHQYPSDDAQVAPTRLGNAIRAFEVYGWDRYRLDTQTVWTELESVAPEHVRNELERARVPVDFCVAALYLSALIGIGLVALGVTKSPTWFIGTGVGLGLAWLWYHLAVLGTGYWYATVQAMVNLGRVPLATALGLVIPDDFETEREMWDAAMEFTREKYDDGWGAKLEPFRSRNSSEQAQSVSAWFGSDWRHPDPAERTTYKIELLNASREPVYQLVARLAPVQGDTRVSEQPSNDAPANASHTHDHDHMQTLSVLPPGRHYTTVPAAPKLLFSRYGVELAFTDRAGVHWLRTTGGSLKQISKPPPDYYELHKPVDWTVPEKVEPSSRSD